MCFEELLFAQLLGQSALAGAHFERCLLYFLNTKVSDAIPSSKGRLHKRTGLPMLCWHTSPENAHRAGQLGHFTLCHTANCTIISACDGYQSRTANLLGNEVSIDHEVFSRGKVSRAQGPRTHAARGLAGGRRLSPGRTHLARAPHGTYPIVFQAKFCYLCCREKPGFLSRDGLPGDSVCEAASAQRSSSPIYSYRDDTTCCSTSSPMVSSFVPC